MVQYSYGRNISANEGAVKGTGGGELSTDAVRPLSTLVAVRRQRRRRQLGEVRVSEGVAERHSVVTVVLKHPLDDVEQLTMLTRVRRHVSLYKRIQRI